MDTLNSFFTFLTWACCILAFATIFQFTLKDHCVKSLNTIQNFPHQLFKHNYYIVCLCLVALTAILVRSWEFSITPGGFNQDGAMAAVDAKALSDYGTDRFGMKFPVHFTAWGYGQMSVLLSYLMIPFIKVFGLNEFSARLPQLLVSFAGLWALFGFTRQSFGRPAALIITLIAVINPWHIMQSRWALDCNLFPHMIIIACCFLVKACTSVRYLYVSMFFFALSMYTYGIAFFSVPIFLFIIVTWCLIKKIFSLKQTFLAFLTYSALSLPIWLVMVINFLKLKSIEFSFMTMPFFPHSVRSNEILLFSNDFFKSLSENYSALLKTTISQSRDLSWNAIDAFGTQYQFALPLVLLGLGLSVFIIFKATRENAKNPTKSTEIIDAEKTRQHLGFIILLAGILTSIWIGLVIGRVNVNRINFAYYFLIISAGLGLHYTYRFLRPAFVTTLSIYLVSFFCFINAYFGAWSEQISRSFYKGMSEALTAAAKIDTQYYFVTVNSQYKGAKPVSEILTLFYHAVDARYFQGTPIADLDGKKTSNTIASNTHQLPYKERYQYIKPESMKINDQLDAVYIIRTKEERFFPQSKFEITQFDQYSLAVPAYTKATNIDPIKLKND